jgi:hypothetical protein
MTDAIPSSSEQNALRVRKETKMKYPVFIAAAALLAAFASNGHSFPIGFSASGGIGIGYYAMNDLNDHIHITNQQERTTIPDLSNGANFNLQGRVWLLSRFAVTLGYGHYYGTVRSEKSEVASTIKVPADVYYIGGVVNVLYLHDLIDVNVGLNRCAAQSTFSIPQMGIDRIKEFKANDTGYEIFVEVVTNFVRPVEVGFQLGYRRLKVNDLKDKFGEKPAAYFNTFDSSMELDYSGAFFFITAGVRI